MGLPGKPFPTLPRNVAKYINGDLRFNTAIFYHLKLRIVKVKKWCDDRTIMVLFPFFDQYPNLVVALSEKKDGSCRLPQACVTRAWPTICSRSKRGRDGEQDNSSTTAARQRARRSGVSDEPLHRLRNGQARGMLDPRRPPPGASLNEGCSSSRTTAKPQHATAQSSTHPRSNPSPLNNMFVWKVMCLILSFVGTAVDAQALL